MRVTQVTEGKGGRIGDGIEMIDVGIEGKEEDEEVMEGKSR